MIEEAKIHLFEKAPVRKAVMSQIFPAIAAQMVMLVHLLADTYFIGLLNDPVLTAAVTLGSSPSFVLTAIANLFGVGAGTSISRSLGEKDYEKCPVFSSAAFWLGTGAAAVYAILLFVFMRPILNLCGATGPVYEPCADYSMWVAVYGACFGVWNPLLANLVRSEGNSAAASAGIMAGAVLNIILDPLFIMPEYLGLGAGGAGAATALGNALTALIFFIFIIRRSRKGVLSLSPAFLTQTGRVIREILGVGIPSAVQTALTVVAVTAMAKFVSFYGTAAVAGYGIVKKLNMLPIFVVVGISNGLMPLLAYNYASGNEQRRKSVFRLGVTISIVFAVICLIFYEVYAEMLAGIFIKDQETIHYAAGFLRRIVVAQPLMAFCYPMLIQLQAMKEVKAALICSVVRKGALDIPLLFLMDSLAPLYGCLWVQPIVDTISLIVEIYFYRKVTGQLRSAPEEAV